jgi:hypothetical protein
VARLSYCRPLRQLKFDNSALQAKAGTVTLAMKNASQVPHNLEIERRGAHEKGRS